MNARLVRAHALLITLSLVSSMAAAETGSALSTAVIGHAALNQAHGVIAVNQAAGDDNQQANLRAFAGNSDSASIDASVLLDQSATNAPVRADGVMQAHVAAAFQSMRGVLSINQVAGAGNRQGNLVSIGRGHGGEVLSDRVLSENVAVSPSPAAVEASTTKVRQVSIDDNAFVGARGIVQLNQTAGVGNQSANLLGIRIVPDLHP
ncbi:hypothetical protein [uncultured Azonexus sp.]|uniref:hypothetical protein n=1 Tax=uncultured Azonexus sp. TaxID=520307 RepID=UPI002610A6D3|nr:hypothetical protein [uncultured Azonexus sp.]